MTLISFRVIAAVGSVMWIASSAVAEEFLVTNLADAGTGSLRSAVAIANNSPGSDVIRFKSSLRGVIKLTGGQIDVTDDLIIAGTGRSRIMVSGSKTQRIFKIAAKVDVSIEDITIADGRNTIQESIPILVTRGGAILNDGGTLRLFGVLMRNNVTIDDVDSQVVGGGAIVNSGFATLYASNCQFVNNIAHGGTSYAFGGAIGNVTQSKAICTNCVFSGNLATSGGTNYGGAIGNFGGSDLTISDCIFHDNDACGVDPGEMAFGGAIATRPGTVDGSGSLTTIKNSLLLANQSIGVDGGAEFSGADAGGGALYNFDSTLFVESSILLANRTIGGDGKVNGGNAYGGAVYSFSSGGNNPSLIQISSCLFHENLAAGGKPGTGTGGQALGGALHNASSSEIQLAKSTISGNRAFGGKYGQGVGGGLYTLGSATADTRTIRNIVGNKASTSNDNVFGTITP